MLRRYLISNVASTAGLYFAYAAFVPSMSSVADVAHNAVQSFVMGHSLLGPMIGHMVVVSANVAGGF
jgi:hypothetical protein